MVSSRTVSVLLGRSKGDAGSYFTIGGILFLLFVVGSIAYHSLLGSLVPGWPLTYPAAVVRVGTAEVPYSTVSRMVHLVVLGSGLAASVVAARRQQGLLVSILFAAAAIVGFQAGATIYYPLFGLMLGSPSEWFGGVVFGLLVAVPVGVLGFLISRAVHGT